MVLIKRRSCPPSFDAKTPSKSSIKLPFGDGRISPKGQITPPHTHSPESGSKSFSFHQESSRKSLSVFDLPSWIIKVVAGCVLLSWVVAGSFTSKARSSLDDLVYQEQLAILHHEQALELLKEKEASRKELEEHVEKLRHTQHVLSHEKRVVDEMQEAYEGGKVESIAIDTLKQRQDTLQEKVDSLRSHIQFESKRDVLEKYGPGPHRVKLTIEFVDTLEVDSFVIETVPLDDMPHSIHHFLEAINRKLWDQTAFWHHPGADHIVMSAAVNYKAKQPKIHYFDAVGLGGVSFAEYSDKYPHEPYTVGFAGRGPIFYINTADNTELHGPGGQAHHHLPNEADPCFAKVVEGREVVDRMHGLSISQSSGFRERSDNWWDNELTRILKAEILTAR